MSSPLRVALLSSLTLVTAACATEPDPDLLSRFEDLPPGATCAAGGVSIVSGHDVDGDGRLDADEIETRTPRCTAPAPASLTRRDELAAGAQCPAGGTAFHTGRDVDGDGALDDAEIESTAVACSADAIWDGDLTITTADLHEGSYAAVRVVTGALRVSGAGEGTLAALEAVGGDVFLSEEAAIALPSLVSVAGKLGTDGSVPTLVAPRLVLVGGDLDAGSIVELALPALERVAGIWTSDEIVAIDLPALVDIAGDLVVADNAALARVSLPALTSAGRIELHLGADATVDLGSLSGLASLAISSTDATRTELDLARLLSVSGELLLHDLAITDLSSLPNLRKAGVLRVSTNAALTAVTGLHANLEVGELDLMSNAALTSLAGLPALGTVERLKINNNDALVDLRGLDGITWAKGNVFIGNNLLLESLDGLALRRIDGELRLLRNFELTSITALDALQTLGGDLQVGFNPIPPDDLAALRTRLGR
jgi:hypothetical protein